MKKLSSATYGFIFAIVALVILLAISLYLGLSGWFYAGITHLESDIPLGETVNLSVRKNSSQAVSFTFPGSLIPGQKLSQNINITNIDDVDLNLRAKATVFDYQSGQSALEVGINEHWTQEGEYYYFDTTLPVANKISLCSFVKLMEEKYFDSSKSYVLTIIVESLDKSLDRSAIWGY